MWVNMLIELSCFTAEWCVAPTANLNTLHSYFAARLNVIVHAGSPRRLRVAEILPNLCFAHPKI